jgi:hypothetical protein
MGVLLRADLTGHGYPRPSAKKHMQQAYAVIVIDD